MTLMSQAPISTDWTTGPAQDEPSPGGPTAATLAGRLGELRVVDIDPSFSPYLAAAAAELAMQAGIGWRFSTDDAIVALLRVIARAAIVAPGAGGPNTTRLHEQLN